MILQSDRRPPAILSSLRGFNVVPPKTGRMADSVEETEQFCSDSPRRPAYDFRERSRGSFRERSRGSLSVRRSKGSGHHFLETERSYSIVICLPTFGALGCK